MRRSPACRANGGHLMRSDLEESVGERLELLKIGSQPKGQMDG
jgi:hypothetical protein